MTSGLPPADDVERALAELGLDRSHRPVVTRLAEAGPPAEPVRLPPPGAAAALLERLGLEPSEVDEVLAARPGASAHPALWWLLERCHHQLVQQMGRPGALGPWPTLPGADGTPGAVERNLYVWVFVATLPFVRRYHDEREVPEEASWEILAAIGTQMADHRAVSGVGGMHTQDWLTVHFRGLIYAVGRLYYERLPVWFDTEQSGALGSSRQRGEWSLGLHIPSGRLSPAACDESLAQATRFFPRHFAEEDYRYAVCTSWVLDPQLVEYLSPTTNIMRYQQRSPCSLTRPTATATPQLSGSCSVVRWPTSRSCLRRRRYNARSSVTSGPGVPGGSGPAGSSCDPGVAAVIERGPGSSHHGVVVGRTSSAQDRSARKFGDHIPPESVTTFG